VSIRVNRWLSLLFVRLVVAIHRHRRFHDRPIARVRFDLEFAAEHFGALAHAGQPEASVLAGFDRMIGVEGTSVVCDFQADVPHGGGAGEADLCVIARACSFIQAKKMAPEALMGLTRATSPT